MKNRVWFIIELCKWDTMISYNFWHLWCPVDSQDFSISGRCSIIAHLLIGNVALNFWCEFQRWLSMGGNIWSGVYSCSYLDWMWWKIHHLPLFELPKCMYIALDGLEGDTRLLSGVEEEDNTFCSCCVWVKKEGWDEKWTHSWNKTMIDILLMYVATKGGMRQKNEPIHKIRRWLVYYLCMWQRMSIQLFRYKTT
jgi:hypothetical protein